MIAPAILVVGLLGAGCGGSDDEDSTQTDAAFAAQMVPHHEHAIEMADLALQTTSDPGVTQLAQGIVESQEAELETLEGLLDRFGASVEEPAPEIATLNEGVIAELEAASGPEFDEIFLKEMSAHHSSAVDMSGIEIAGGADDETVQLAEQIESTQIEEIGVMQELLGVPEASGEHGSDSEGHGAE
jgi:uncharacterized protein (DUF305 family)